jgi:hypothetical protein
MQGRQDGQDGQKGTTAVMVAVAEALEARRGGGRCGSWIGADRMHGRHQFRPPSERKGRAARVDRLVRPPPGAVKRLCAPRG